MEELVRQVVERTGISEAQARTAVETVVGFLKERLPAPIAAHVDRGERVEDVAALDLGERGPEAVGVAHGGRLPRGVADAGREAVERDRVPAQGEGALDGVLQFADV